MIQYFTGVIRNMDYKEHLGEKDATLLSLLVSEEKEQYPDSACFEVWNETAVGTMQRFKIGDTVSVSYHHQTREYNGKFYNTLKAWKVGATMSEVELNNTAKPEAPVQQPVQQAPFAPTPEPQKENDLPF